jgi:hypothetical protein
VRARARVRARVRARARGRVPAWRGAGAVERAGAAEPLLGGVSERVGKRGVALRPPRGRLVCEARREEGRGRCAAEAVRRGRARAGCARARRLSAREEAAAAGARLARPSTTGGGPVFFRQGGGRRAAPGAWRLRRRARSWRMPDDASSLRPAASETCPISTEGWTRRVHFVREGGGRTTLAACGLRQARRGARTSGRVAVAAQAPPPFPCTNWTRLVLSPVLSGHLSSLPPY